MVSHSWKPGACMRYPRGCIDGWVGGWLDEWLDDRNLDFILFRLDHMKLLFLFKNHQIFNFTQTVVFEGERVLVSAIYLETRQTRRG